MQTFQEMIRPFVLELLRVAVIAVIPVTILAMETKTFDWKAIAIVGAIAVLKALDRMLHETGVAERGLTRF